MLRLQGLRKAVQAVSFAPDGRTLASAGNDHRVHLWEQGTGKEVAQWEAHKYAILALAFAPDGKTIASGCFDLTIRVWDAGAHKKLADLKGQRPGIMALAFSPDGKTLAAAEGGRLSFDKGGGLDFWETGTWKHQGSVTAPATNRTGGGWAWGGRHASPASSQRVPFGGIQDIRYSRDGRSLLLATAQRGAVLCDLGSTEPQVSFLQGGCRSADLSADGRTIAAAEAKNIQLYDTTTGQRRATLSGHKGLVWSVAISPDGQFVLSGAKDGTVCLWELSSGRLLASYDWDIGTIQYVAFAPDGMTAAVAGHTGTVILWDVDPSDLTGRTDVDAEATSVPQFAPIPRSGPLRLDHKKGVAAVAFAPDGKTVTSVAHRDRAKVWDRATGKPIARFPSGRYVETGPGLAFTPDGASLVTSSWYSSKAATVWNLKDEEARLDFDHFAFTWTRQHFPRLGGASLALSPDGKQIMLGIRDPLPPSRSRLVVWVRHAKPVDGVRASIVETDQGVLALAYAPDGRTLAVANGNGRILLWDLGAERRLPVRFKGEGKCPALAFAPDGKALAGAVGRQVLLWDLEGNIQQTLTGHKGEVRTVAFAPDGRSLLSGGSDRIVRWWDAGSGQERASWDWQIGNVNSVAVSPDGKSAAAGGHKGIIMVWDLNVPLPGQAK
jgi:WD40 repeat protein